MSVRLCIETQISWFEKCILLAKQACDTIILSLISFIPILEVVMFKNQDGPCSPYFTPLTLKGNATLPELAGIHLSEKDVSCP